MDRIDDLSAEQDKHGVGKDGWTNGDPTDPNSGTIGQEEWFDGVQEELLNIIETRGLTPAALVFTQVLDALELHFLKRDTTAGSNSMATSISFDSVPSDATPRLLTATASDDLIYWINQTLSGGEDVNIYIGDDGVEVLWEATFLQGTGYVTAGSNEGGIRLRAKDDGTNGPSVELLGGGITAGNFNESVIISGDPNATTVSAGEITAAAVPRAWAKITNNTGATTTTLTSNSRGITATHSNDAAGLFDVNIVTAPFATTDFFVQVTPASVVTNHIHQAGTSSGSLVKVRAIDGATGTAINTNTTQTTFFIMVHGV